MYVNFNIIVLTRIIPHARALEYLSERVLSLRATISQNSTKVSSTILIRLYDWTHEAGKQIEVLWDKPPKYQDGTDVGLSINPTTNLYI